MKELSVKDIIQVKENGEVVCVDTKKCNTFYFYRGEYYKYNYEKAYFVSMIKTSKANVIAYIKKYFNEDVKLELLDLIDPEISTRVIIHKKYKKLKSAQI